VDHVRIVIEDLRIIARRSENLPLPTDSITFPDYYAEQKQLPDVRKVCDCMHTMHSHNLIQINGKLSRYMKKYQAGILLHLLKCSFLNVFLQEIRSKLRTDSVQLFQPQYSHADGSSAVTTEFLEDYANEVCCVNMFKNKLMHVNACIAYAYKLQIHSLSCMYCMHLICLYRIISTLSSFITAGIFCAAGQAGN
jgi:hypothetical protein